MLTPVGLEMLQNYWCPLFHVNASTVGAASTTVGPAMPWSHKESPQPLTKDQLGFPPGVEVTESSAARLARQPAATHST